MDTRKLSAQLRQPSSPQFMYALTEFSDSHKKKHFLTQLWALARNLLRLPTFPAQFLIIAPALNLAQQTINMNMKHGTLYLAQTFS